MRKLLSSLVTLTFIAGSTATSVVACSGGNTIAQKEGNQLNNENVNLQDNRSHQYEGRTAHQDNIAIKDAIVQDGYLRKSEVKNLSFDNTRNLQPGMNKGVPFMFKPLVGSPAKGTINIYIQPAKFIPGISYIQPAT